MASALSAVLKSYDMLADRATSLMEAAEIMMAGTYDAILLDRNLPDGDGITLIPKLRAKAIPTPVIVLTARGELSDRVAGLDTGADDYLAKPFAVEELLARLRAVWRRPADLQHDIVRVGRLSFNLNHCEAEVDGRLLELPRRELLVLQTLMRRMGRTVVRSSLEAAVYSLDEEVQSNALDTHVSRLRRKLTDAGAGVEIHGIRGVGYLLRAAS
jgi:DNA-binding response OmpR family regulator